MSGFIRSHAHKICRVIKTWSPHAIEIRLTLLRSGMLTACGGLADQSGRREVCIGRSAKKPAQVSPVSKTAIAPGEACVDEVCVGGSSETDGEGGEDGGPIACLTTNDCPFGEFCDLGTGTCVGCLLDEHCDPVRFVVDEGTGSEKMAVQPMPIVRPLWCVMHRVPRA